MEIGRKITSKKKKERKRKIEEKLLYTHTYISKGYIKYKKKNGKKIVLVLLLPLIDCVTTTKTIYT